MLIIQSFGFPPWCLTFPVHFFPVLNFFPHVPALFDLGPLFYLWDSILCLLLDVFMLAVCFLVGLLCFLSVHLYFSLSPLQCFYLLTEFYLQTLDIFVTSNIMPRSQRLHRPPRSWFWCKAHKGLLLQPLAGTLTLTRAMDPEREVRAQGRQNFCREYLTHSNCPH